jgi:hypothetical protein
LLEVCHLLDGFIVWGLSQSAAGSIDLILEGLNMLLELISSLHRNCVSLVVLAVKDAHIIVASLIFLRHISRVRLRLIINALVLGLDDPADCFFLPRCLLLLENIEIHLC